MRRWIACCALLLSACLISEPPQIPQSELAQPADLAGGYWAVPIERSPQEQQPWLVEFRRGPDSQMVVDEGTRPAYASRLVGLAMPGVYLYILHDTVDGPDSGIKAIYHLLVRRELGVWDEYELRIDPIRAGGAFGTVNFAYLQAVAARHGLGLDASDADTTVITGNVHGTAIPALFRDRDFLAALEVNPFIRYLPRPPAPAPGEQPMFLFSAPSIQLVLDQPDLPGAPWAQPSGFEGDYVRAVDGPHILRVWAVRFRRLPDGRFEKTMNGNREVVGLLPLGAGSSGQYLWVSFDQRRFLDPSRVYLALSVLRRNERGWTVEPVLRRGSANLAGGEDLLAVPMRIAAERQGVRLDRFEIKGGITAQGLLGLLGDGQFTTGLVVDRSSPERYAPRETDRMP